LAVVALLATLGLALIWSFPSLHDLEADLSDGREYLGYWGLVLLAAAYTPVCLVLVPVMLLSLSAGYFYPILPAVVAVSAGLTAAASVVFLLGRTLLRGWVLARFGHLPSFQVLDQAVAEQGFKIVLLTRLSPLFPFIVLNYAFSLTRVSFRAFVLATWLGTLPSTVLYVYLGSTVKDFAQLLGGEVAGADMVQVQVWQTAITSIGLLATIAVTLQVTRLARQALRRAMPAARAEAPLIPDLEPLPAEQVPALVLAE